MYDHICKKWASVPGISSRIRIFFTDHMGRQGENLFQSLESPIYNSLSGELAKFMSVRLDDIVVYQVHYFLLPLHSPSQYNTALPSMLSQQLMPRISSSTQTALSDPNAVLLQSNYPLSSTSGRALTQVGDMMLMRPLRKSDEAPAAVSAVPICPDPLLEEEIEFKMSENTIAFMLNACGASQLHAPPDGGVVKAALRPSECGVSALNIVNSKPNEDRNLQSFGHSCKAASSGNKNFLECINSKEIDGGFTSTVDHVAGQEGEIAFGADGFLKDGIHVPFSEGTIENMFNAFCGSNTFMPLSSRAGEVAANDKTSGGADDNVVTTGSEIHDAAAVQSPITTNANSKITTLNTINSICIVPVDGVPPVVPPGKESGDVNSKKRKFGALVLPAPHYKTVGLKNARKKKLKRITPTFIGTLKDAPRFVMGHFKV